MGTQNELAEHYGPQTTQIEALLERAHNLSGDETEALWDAWDAWDAGAAWVAGRRADRRADRDAARDAAWYAWAAVRNVSGRDAIWDAVQALLVRDLIGQHDFTQEHYDTLVAPWESVMGTTWTRETL